jgi:hypothetical protein
MMVAVKNRKDNGEACKNIFEASPQKEVRYNLNRPVLGDS